MGADADFAPDDVTNLRDVVDVSAPFIDVGDSSLSEPPLFSDESPTVQLSGLLSRNSVMTPVTPVENVPVVGESLIPTFDSDRIPISVTLNTSDSAPCDVMQLLCMRQSSSMRLVLHRLF